MFAKFSSVKVLYLFKSQMIGYMNIFISLLVSHGIIIRTTKGI